MMMPMTRNSRMFRTLVALSAVALAAAGCGSSTSTTKPAAAGGTASVAYAGSLNKLYNETLGPDFKKATGYDFGGPPSAGSTALAQEILAGDITPGVFMAVGAKPIELLFPAHAKFALALATDPLVVAFTSKSRYYSQLEAIAKGSSPLTDLFSLMATSGFRLGRTDPTQDPQGEFFICMMKLAQTELKLPAGEANTILGITSGAPYGSAQQMLSEDALPTDIATGTVDAGSEYLSEALQNHLNYISLPADLDFATPADASIYSTVSIEVSGAAFQGKLITLDVALVTPKAKAISTADETADDAFVNWLLSSEGRSVLAANGYTLGAPIFEPAAGVTAAEALPSSVLASFDALHGVTKAS